MKKYDFIIGYEHKNREVESICLLKRELERRGYSVLIYNTNDERFKEHIKKCYAEVLLLPYAYNDKLISFCVRRVIAFRKLINLQWEQAIYRNQEENPDSYKNPSGICKKAVHLSWGKANVNRLIHIVGIDPRRVRLVGNMALDFLKPPLSDYFLSREEVLKRYHIPKDKKICLLIASFKAALASEETLKKECQLYGEWRREQSYVARRTMEKILEWIQSALKENPELFFIYRPHPGEKTYIVDDIQKKCDRFVVIKELSVKQWILVVDKIYTWMSTTLAEVYFAQKGCCILFPYEVPKEAKSRLYDEMKAITDYNSFLQSLSSDKIDFPISGDILNEYYLVKPGMSYIRIADVCEEVLRDSYYEIDNTALKEIYLMSLPKKVVKRIGLWLWNMDGIYGLFYTLVGILPLKGRYVKKKLDDRRSYEKWKQEEFVSDVEIQNICDKIGSCLERVNN